MHKMYLLEWVWEQIYELEWTHDSQVDQSLLQGLTKVAEELYCRNELSGGCDKLLEGCDELLGGHDKLLRGHDELLGGHDELLGGHDVLGCNRDASLGVRG